MKKESSLKNLIPKKRDPNKYKDLKVAINIRLDVHVVAKLRAESERLAIPYQTFINSLLKQGLDQRKPLTADDVRAIVREEIFRNELEKKAAAKKNS